MEGKLKGILQILEEDKKNNDKREKEEKVEVEKKESAKTEKAFSCEKRESSSFNYVKPEFLYNKNDYSKYPPKKHGEMYLKSYAQKFEHGKETVELFNLLCKYESQPSERTIFMIKPEAVLKRVQQLIDKGANVNFVNNQSLNDTCLTKAIQSKDADLISLLLKNGANPNVEDNWPTRFLFLIVIKEKQHFTPLTQVFKDMIEKYDADIYMKNSNGEYLLLNDYQKYVAFYRTHNPWAKDLLVPYGFTDEDFKTENVKQPEQKFDEKFDEEFQIPENL